MPRRRSSAHWPRSVWEAPGRSPGRWDLTDGTPRPTLSPVVTAGAVISGAYFGDKLSPLSDTTNLAAAAVGVDLFEHIKNMLSTTPAFIAALLVFTLIGSEGASTPENIASIRAALDAQFAISPFVLSPLCLMLGLIYWRVPAYPAILICTLAGIPAVGGSAERCCSRTRHRNTPRFTSTG